MIPEIALDPAAAGRLQKDLRGRLLRIAFTTGCGGSGYRLSVSDEPIEGDHLVEVGAVRIALDDMAWRNLDGATIVVDEEEDGYLLDHPSAAVCVWCG